MTIQDPFNSAPATVSQPLHSDPIEDIISKPPTWLIRWGTTVFFSGLVLMIGISILVKYPDVVKTSLKINSKDSPKPIVTKRSGKLTKILITDGQFIEKGQSLAFLESTADHKQVIDLLESLKKTQKSLNANSEYSDSEFATNPAHLGESQQAYQIFFQSYLNFKSTIKGGFLLKKRRFLENELANIATQKYHLEEQRQLQQRELRIAENEYKTYQDLAEKKVLAPMELKREEAKLLQKSQPLQQTTSGLLNNSALYLSKEREIFELDNQIIEARFNFQQALNSLISEIENWRANYVLSSTQSGNVSFSGVVQENQFIEANQEVFFIMNTNIDYFGEMRIPQHNMGKVQKLQDVLIKLDSYPFEEYGMLRGKIEYISEVPFQDTVFTSRVRIINEGITDRGIKLQLKNGMIAVAEVITEDASLLSRIYRNITSY